MAVAALLAAIDVGAPWLAPYRGALDALHDDGLAGLSVAAALNRVADASVSASPMRFVPQADLPADEPYECFIRRSRTVPTRDNLHDLLNGLVWLRYPALKQRLNALHAAQMAAEPVGPRRGPVRDALTLFDENAAVWWAPPVLVDALARRDWRALFVTHRGRWPDAALTLVGHALIEKLCRPHKAITAHVWIAPTPADALPLEPWQPMPVLGVPGWWPANEKSGFYDDERVFRPLRFTDQK